MKNFLVSAAAPRPILREGAYVLFRLHLGLSIAFGAGWSKLIDLTTTTEWSKLLASPGALRTPDWFVQQVATLGFTFPSPYLWAALAVWGEFVGGLLVAAGLFTRIAAAQLAFQFLIIAFFWYATPELLLGMYYQQLLFWAFVLVTVLGGGRYSLDYWLSQRPASAATDDKKKVILAAVCLGMLVTQLAVAQQTTATPLVTATDLRPLLRSEWQGALTYRDYQNQQLVTLPTQLHVSQVTPQELTLSYDYREPNGKVVQGTDHLRLQENGTQLEWDGLLMQVQRKQKLPAHTLRLELLGEGQDNNRSATIRRTVLLAEKRYSVRKEVRFAGDTTFLLRHEYLFRQQAE